MVTFDRGRRHALVQLSLMGVSMSVRLDLKDILSEPLLRDSRLGELDPKRLKALVEYVDHRFKLDRRSSLPWKEQFCRALVKECGDLLSLPVKLTPEEIRELKVDVRRTNRELAAAAKVEPDKFRKALTYQYHDGFHHLTRDDDFIAVRCGDRIVGIIALPGNDRNEVKRFIRAARGRMFEPRNLADVRRAVREVRKSEMARALRLGTAAAGGGRGRHVSG